MLKINLVHCVKAMLLAVLCLVAKPETASAGYFLEYHNSHAAYEGWQQAKTITLQIKDMELKDVLAEIAKQAGLGISYNSDLVPKRKITVNLDKRSPQDALETVLKGTDLKAVITKWNTLSLEKTPPPLSPNVQAGQGTGAVKGRIVEFESSNPLPGATVRILGTQIAAQSDESGYYNLTGIPAGNQSLEVSFIGYSTEAISVTVRAGQTGITDIRLQGSNTLEEVVISGIAKTRRPVPHATERQVLEEIKMAQSIVSGISSQQISKTADRNAAEVVQKIAGVTVRDDKFIVIRGMNERYNLTYLNNNIAPSTELHSRAFALDLIPTRIIDRIMVYKSPAPDLMADMTGGAVKIFTKDAKTVKHFDVEFRTGFRQNTTFNKDFLTYQGGKFDFLGFDDGGRKLPNSVPGFGDFTKANISQKTYAETFSNILEYGKKTALPPVQLTLNYYNTVRVGGKFLSILSSLSYNNESTHLDVDRQQVQGEQFNTLGKESQNTDASQLSLLQNFTYTFNEKNKIYFKNFLLQQGQQYTLLNNSKEGLQSYDGNWLNPQDREVHLRNIVLQWSQRFLYSGNMGGQYTFDEKNKHAVDWNAGYTYSRLSLPDQRIIRLQNNINYNDSRFPKSGDFEQNFVPVFRSEDWEVSNNNLDLGHISRLWTRNTEIVYNGSVDYTYKVYPWVTLKAGTFQQWKERVVFRRAYTVNEGDLNSSGGFPNDRIHTIGAFAPEMDFNIVFWRQQDLGKLWSTEYLRDDNTGLKVFDRTSGSDAYTATEQNNSGYIAASLLPFGDKLDIYGGLRAEYNRQKVAGAIPPFWQGDVNQPVLANLKSTEWLPSLNIGYRPNNDWVVRAAYGKTVNRPEFRELSPYSELDFVNNQQIAGNSDLVFATVNNYDLRLEWYPKANETGETVSVGGFYKNITNPIERTIYRELDPNQPMPAQISFQNADNAEVYGLELDIRKNLDFISGSFFRNLSVAANGSYIFSKVATDSTGMNLGVWDSQLLVNDRKLQGQAPYQYNAGLYYDNAGSGTRAAFIYNVVGERIYAAARGRSMGTIEGDYPDWGTQGSLIELPRRQLDFSLTQRIVNSLQAKLSVQNVLNQSIDMVEDVNYTFKYEKVRYIPDTSGSANTAPDTVEGDPKANSYRPGRFFLLTLTYGF